MFRAQATIPVASTVLWRRKDCGEYEFYLVQSGGSTNSAEPRLLVSS